MSDGHIEFMMALSGHEQIDAYPVKRISREGGEIISAHARKDSRGVFVFGYVGNRYGANSVTTATLLISPQGCFNRAAFAVEPVHVAVEPVFIELGKILFQNVGQWATPCPALDFFELPFPRNARSRRPLRQTSTVLPS